MHPRLISIHEYPLKSAAGMERDDAEVFLHGLERDRRWLLMSEGSALSQRMEPLLAKLRTRDSHGRVLVSFGGEELALGEPDQGLERSLELWGREVRGIDLGERSAEFFSTCLGRAVRALYMPAPLIGKLAAHHPATGSSVGFADDFPLLLTTVESLENLNRRLDVPLPMNRFRPNLVVQGFDAFEEDRWQRLRIGRVTFRAPKSCPRCRVTTIDQETSRVGTEPLATLATYRKAVEGVLFGRYLVPEGTGTVCRGDEVRILEAD